MNPLDAQRELVRAVELACLHINPPHDPRAETLTLDELGAAGLALGPVQQAAQSAYLRELQGWDQQPAAGRLEPWRVEVGHLDAVNALAVLADGRLASGSDDRTIRIWTRAAEGRWPCEATLQGHTDSISSLAVLADGRLASGSYDKTIRVWTHISQGRWLCEATLEASHYTQVPASLNALA